MKLEVIYKGKQKAGELWRDNMGYHFIYEDAFLNDDTTRPISVNMPKSQKEYHSKELFHYFQSILSEGENRKKICNALGIDISDDWGLLVYSCSEDTIGAIIKGAVTATNTTTQCISFPNTIKVSNVIVTDINMHIRVITETDSTGPIRNIFSILFNMSILLPDTHMIISSIR